MKSRQLPAVRGQRPAGMAVLAALVASSSSNNPNKEIVVEEKKASESVVPTVVEVAQELQSETSFISLVLKGNGATFLTEDTIFGYVVDSRGRFFKVLRSGNPKLPQDLTISSDEVRRQVDMGKDYTPRGNAANPVQEMARAVMINIMKRAVDSVGGNDAVLAAIEAARKKAEAKDRQKQRAEKILADIGNGTLSGDLMKMFDPMAIVMFGVLIDGKPAVLRSGTIAVDKHGEYFAHCVQVLSAPLPCGLSEGAFVEVAKIFDEFQPHPHAARFAEKLRTLFTEEQTPLAKSLSQKLKAEESGNTSSEVVVMPPVPMPTTATVQ